MTVEWFISHSLSLIIKDYLLIIVILEILDDVIFVQWLMNIIRNQDQKSILVYMFTSLVKEYTRIITFHELNVTPLDEMLSRDEMVTTYKLSY